MSKGGITRRIDELGRIVVPKEIRCNLGIRDGEPLEIYTNDGNIIVKKYSQVENIKDLAELLCDIISEVCNVGVIITDREKVIVGSNNLQQVINMELDNKYKNLIDNREEYIPEKEDVICNIKGYITVVPIVTSSDSSGLIVIMNVKKSEEDLKYAKIIQKLIVNKLDV